MIYYNDQFKEKRIIIIIPSLNGGGAESTAVNLANMFYKNKYSVKIICIYEYSRNPNLSKNINVTSLRVNKISNSIFKIRDVLSNLESSIIISFITSTNIVLSISKIFLKKKHFYILTQHEIPSLNLAKSKYFYLIFLMKIFYPFSDAIICVSKGLELEVQKLLNHRQDKKIHTIYNLVEKKYKFKRKRSKTYKLLSVGRLVKAKGFESLLEGVYILKNKLNFKLTIVGNGPQEKYLKSLIRRLGIGEICQIKNYQSDIDSFYKNSDIYISTSIYESFGNTIVEAMQYGMLIIATNCPYGPKEILCNGKLGKLIDPNSPLQIANSILETIKIKKTPNYKIFLNKCSEENVLNNFEYIFKKIQSK